MTGIAKGEKLRAKGRVLQGGRTNSIGAADVYSVSDGSFVRDRARHDPKLQDKDVIWPGWRNGSVCRHLVACDPQPT